MSSIVPSVSVVTQVCKNKCAFLWEIRGFPWLDCSVGATVESPIFTLVNREWSVQLCPGGWQRVDRGFMSVFLVSQQSETTRAQFAFMLVDKRGNDLHRYDSVHNTFRSLGDPIGCHEFISLADVLDTSRGFLDPKHDTLRIKCVIDHLDVASPLVFHTPDQLTAQSMQATLAQDLSGLLLDAKHSDVQFVVEGTAIHAHRSVLSVRSPYFKAMFSHEMEEKNEGIVRLNDIRLCIFQQMLRFVYTGLCDGSGASASNRDVQVDGKVLSSELDFVSLVDLLVAGDRFQLSDLVLWCAQRLTQNLTPQKAIELLVLSDTHSVSSLKKRVLDLIRHNVRLLSEMLSLKSSLDLDPTLLRDLLTLFAPIVSEPGTPNVSELFEVSELEEHHHKRKRSPERRLVEKSAWSRLGESSLDASDLSTGRCVAP